MTSHLLVTVPEPGVRLTLRTNPEVSILPPLSLSYSLPLSLFRFRSLV